MYHDFFLDEGITKFNDMDGNQKESQLRLYNLNDFFVIEPTIDTKRISKNQRFICRTEQDGLKVAVETLSPTNVNDGLPRIPVISIDPKLELYFIVKFKYPDFINYTNLDFDTNKLLLLTNEELNEIPSMKLLPLANPNDGYLDDNFFMDPITQAEVLKKIKPQELFGSVAVVRMKMVCPIDPAKNIIIDKNSIYNPAKKFVLQFDNKKLFWQYRMFGDNTIYRTITKYPLVKNGFITINSESALTPPLEISSGMKLPNPLVYNLENIQVDNVEELSTVIYI